jgi:hypothetical protein
MARISGKDLAAIAALGVAGTMAYRDYNKKKEASAAKEAKDNAREVAEPPSSVQTRREALQKQADIESAERNYDYNPSEDVERPLKGGVATLKKPVSATRIAPTRANAVAAVNDAAATVNSAPDYSAENARLASYQNRANALRAPRVPLTISPEEQARESAKFGNYPRRGASAATNQSMSDMGIGSGMKRGGKVSSKPKASSASSRGDGIAQRGKTRGKYL